MRPVIYCLTLAVCGCGIVPTSSTSAPRPDAPDPEAIVPIGTSSEDALRLLEDAGYTCSLMENERFRYQPPDAPHRDEGYYAEGIDFIQCSRTDQNGLVTWIDVWALVIDDSSRIRRILHRGDGIGP